MHSDTTGHVEKKGLFAEWASRWNGQETSFDPETYIRLNRLIPQEMKTPLLGAIADHDLWKKVKTSLAEDFCKGQTGCYAREQDDFVLACSTLGPGADIPNLLLAPSLGAIRFAPKCSGFSLHTVLARIEEVRRSRKDKSKNRFKSWLGPRPIRMIELLHENSATKAVFLEIVDFLESRNIPFNLACLMEAIVDVDGSLFGKTPEAPY